jgi:hypothetical protein
MRLEDTSEEVWGELQSKANNFLMDSTISGDDENQYDINDEEFLLTPDGERVFEEDEDWDIGDWEDNTILRPVHEGFGMDAKLRKTLSLLSGGQLKLDVKDKDGVWGDSIRLPGHVNSMLHIEEDEIEINKGVWLK